MVSASDGGMTSSSQQLPVLDIPRPFEALSDVSNDSSHNGRDCDSQETAVSERLSQPPSLFSVSTVVSTPSIGTSSPGHTVLDNPRDKNLSSVNSKSRKKSKKHKDKEKSKDREREREKGQETEKERKSREERVPEPNRACEMSPGNLKSNSIPHKSTGESCRHTEISFFSCTNCLYLPKTSFTALTSDKRFLNKSSTSYVDRH